MKKISGPGTTGKRFIFLLSVILFVSGCAVIKKPYVISDYYRETSSILNRLGDKTMVLTGTMQAGFSRVSLTPDLDTGKKIPIAGYGRMKTKYATGLHDSIFVRAVAISSGVDTIVIVCADMLIIPPHIVDSVMVNLRWPGIKRERLFFSATHTHAGPGGWGFGILGRLMAGKRDTGLEKWITDQFIRAITSSLEDLKPAQAGSGSFDAPTFLRNRLTGENSSLNDDFDYIVIDQPGYRKAVLGIYSAHTTNAGRLNTLLTADYPGQWASVLENGHADVALFCGGSMASQSPVGTGDEFRSAEHIGKTLADTLISRIECLKMNERITAASLSLRADLPAYRIRMTKNLTFPTFVSRWFMITPVNVYIQAIRINDLLWFFTPGDFSGELAMMLKRLYAGKGFQTIVSGYNGSYTGYIIPGKYFYLKHYEPRMMGWYGPSMGEYIFDIMDKMGKVLTE